MKMGFDQAKVDAVVDFVQRSYDQVELGLTPDVSQQSEEQRRDLGERLDQEIDRAKEERDKPKEKLLRQVKSGLQTLGRDEKPQPKLLGQLEAARAKLADSDGFGAASSVPKVVDEVIGFLSALFGKAEAPPSGKKSAAPGAGPQAKGEAGEKTSAKAEGKAGEKTSAAGETAQPAVERRVSAPPDPRIKAFVGRFFHDGFDTGAKFTEQQLAAALPEAQRKEFLAMPRAQREFLLSLEDKHQAAYAAMDHDQQQVFRSLKPQERGQYVKMNHDERAFFAKLDPGERATYLTLHPDQRELIRQKGGDPRALLSGQGLFKDLAGKTPAEVSRALGAELISVLGHELPAQGELSGMQLELLDRASSLASNYLREYPNNFAMAKMATLKALMENPDFTDKLLRDVQTVLGAKDQQRGAKAGAQASYVSHFRKIRGLVMEHAQRLLQPGVSREELLGGLAQAVEISAEFQLAHPPRRRALRLSNPSALEARVYG